MVTLNFQRQLSSFTSKVPFFSEDLSRFFFFSFLFSSLVVTLSGSETTKVKKQFSSALIMQDKCTFSHHMSVARVKNLGNT